MLILLTAMTIWGTAPICAYDGSIAKCFYFDFSTCEIAIQNQSRARCIPNPDSR